MTPSRTSTSATNKAKPTCYEVGTDAAASLVERQIQTRLDRYESAGVPTVMSLAGCFGDGPAVFGTEREDPERVAWINERIRPSRPGTRAGSV